MTSKRDILGRKEGTVVRWTRLVDLDKTYEIDIGSTFRFPAIEPWGDYVDYMLVQNVEGYFVIMSGPLAGRPFDPFTIKGRPKGGEVLNAEWMVKNWKEYVYAFCEPEDVYYIGYPPVPQYPPA